MVLFGFTPLTLNFFLTSILSFLRFLIIHWVTQRLSHLFVTISMITVWLRFGFFYLQQYIGYFLFQISEAQEDVNGEGWFSASTQSQQMTSSAPQPALARPVNYDLKGIRDRMKQRYEGRIKFHRKLSTLGGMHPLHLKI